VIRQVSSRQVRVAREDPTVKQAKTSLFAADSNRLYLAVPRQPDQEGPEIRVYTVKE